MISNLTLQRVLEKSKLLNKETLAKTIDDADAAKTDLEDFILKNKILTEEQIYHAASEALKLPLIDLSTKALRKDILFLIPEPIAVAHKIIAFDQTGGEIMLATLDPDNVQIFEFISRKTGFEPKLYLTYPKQFEDTIKQYRLSLKTEFEKIGASLTSTEAAEEAENLVKLAEDLPIIRIVDSILEHAVLEEASDIHIEPQETNVVVRYRIDGILRQVMDLPKITSAGVVARIKILSNLKLDEHRLPQDGRFKISTEQYRLAIRVSILPIADGEKIVMRLLPENAQALTLDQLGIFPKQLELINREIQKPHGILFVTGPTGSGKTTTLYSIIGILNKPGVNISTIEDPIEYRMPLVNQSQVNPRIGFTFAVGLRALLRQDPNIIMVGEIRDSETAEIAINAALTGHLVLSTLHTNDAATTLPRLVEMGVPAYLISSTTNLIIAQRLLRKICKECTVAHTLDKNVVKELEQLFNISDVMAALHREKITAKKTLADISFHKGQGCKKCNNEGYKGRIGIYECLPVTPKIAELLNAHASASEITKVAIAEGMVTLTEDAFIKAVQGVTTIEEIIRVTKD